ncbi:amino acid permease [Corynebacterium sp. HS2168-gen11]|uniref:amino acid permease n=1 Tax=Corynebacterium sp. HS2168-gen11 TaxID=2974027 RepID=UPI00216B42E7|nr:amino acid permease [Corynebacterium sp. HS2168-gen11]MCS4534924.1 amino acid permease [Corynebacterium sp. HS2168-gen11]
MSTDKNNLGTGLKTRHLTMMGLGSAIGAGLFLGTGVGIQAAGPAVILGYIFAGIMVVFFMQMLGELAAARPSSGSFSVYAEQAFGHWAGFTVGWLYWFMLTMVMGAEMTGAAGIMSAWFGVDPWIPALICVTIFAIINLAHVSGFGEFEFWFALIKIAVIIAFLIIGVLLIFGLLPGTEYVGTRNLLGNGFMPNGITGVATGLLAVAFAFGGIEIITIAAAESENPAASISTAVRSVIWRILFFYLGSVIVISALLPYESIGGASNAAESPFTMILSMAHLPYVTGFMELIIVLALLSAFNAQIYGTSRLIFSLAQRRDAPSIFAKISAQGVPTNSVILSMLFAFGSVALQYWNPANLLGFLFNAVGGCLLFLWAMIALTWMKLHPELVRNNELTQVKMAWHPYSGVLALSLLAVLIALILNDPGSRGQISAVIVLAAITIGASFFTPNGRSKKHVN